MPRFVAWIVVVLVVLFAAWLMIGRDRTGGGGQPTPHAIDQNG
ncbi:MULTISPECIES: hypothetical protein [unclassified Mesorhizobium]|nr:hypothetical protein [Mesorhizobium sp. LSJC280B00]